MVKDRVGERTPMTDAEINELIEQSEQYFTVIMKSNGSFGIGGGTFDPAKHGVLRDAVASRAALLIIAATSLSWQTLEQAALAGDILYQVVLGYLNMLSDQDYVAYLKRL